MLRKFLAGVLCLLSSGGALGLRAQGTAATASTVKNDAVVAATLEVFNEMSRIRQLSVLYPARSGTQSRQAIENMVVRNLDEQTTPAQMHATEVTLKKLGMVGADFQLRPFVKALLTEQVAGYYDPKTREFYVADWIDLNAQKPVMAHELTHALQDQHFNLQRLSTWPHGDADAELAAHALVEGDATLAMTQYAFAHLDLMAALASFAAGASGASEQITRAPRSLREGLMFPFDQGLAWVTRLQQRGGWAAVSAAFTKMPLSSEQILHLEKYDAYEPPVKVTIPAIDALLGRGWSKIDEDVQGEWGYYSVLDEFLKAPDVSKAAAAGWGGDRFAVYQGPSSGDVCLVQLSTWDTPADAREFADAYVRRSALRYGTPRQGDLVIDQRGARVAIIEGIPAAANSAALLARLWE
jgi:hypothetical protein